jgi:murein DD-endopeptidase MepM/ murein hydrolase activator NlpD
MGTFSGGALIVLFLVVLSNMRNGTLGDWFGAKFLNRAPGDEGWTPGIGAVFTGGVVPSNLTGAGLLVAPLPGATITGNFNEQRAGHRHGGIDYAAPMGTNINVAGSGRVVAVGPAGDYGNRVIVDHGNGLSTLYAHLSSIGVRVGDQLRQGQVLGKVGMTGRSTGPHLHFEVRDHGVAVNPLEWLADKLKVLTA